MSVDRAIFNAGIRSEIAEDELISDFDNLFFAKRSIDGHPVTFQIATTSVAATF
jgi:hypothetical protein